MKTTLSLPILALAIATLPLTAQTASKTAPATPAKPSIAAAKKPATAQPCVKLPTISPLVPALPAGAPCPKALYTLTTVPSVKLSDISPMEDPNLRDILGIPLPATITLSYVDTKVGTGVLVVPKQWYTVQYTGYLYDGTKFDSSYDSPDHAPFTFQQGPQGPQGRRQVIVGWDTGLDGMRIGGKRRLFIPWQLAYGTTPHGKIPAKADLIFDIELIAQSATVPTPKPPAAPTPAAAPAATPAPPAAPAPAAAPATATPAHAAPAQPAAPKP